MTSDDTPSARLRTALASAREQLDTSIGIEAALRNAVEALRPEHTYACNSRFVHGDGAWCTCGRAGTPLAAVVMATTKLDRALLLLAVLTRRCAERVGFGCAIRCFFCGKAPPVGVFEEEAIQHAPDCAYVEAGELLAGTRYAPPTEAEIDALDAAPPVVELPREFIDQLAKKLAEEGREWSGKTADDNDDGRGGDG